MYSLLDKLEAFRTDLSKWTRYGVISLLAVLSFVFLFVAGGLSNNFMLGLILIFIIAILLLAMEPRKAFCGILILAFFCISLYLRVVPSHDGVFTDTYVRFGGNDPWYHMRLVENLVQHFPHRISFDAYTLFPYGESVPFAPFFDLLLGFVIWVIGAGHPSLETIETVGAYFPAVLGALVVIPVYFIGKELFSRTAGLIAAGLIAVMPGEFFFRSMLGFTDHHIAEVLFSTTAVMFLIMAMKRAKQREITFGSFHCGECWRSFQERDWRALIRASDWRSLRLPLIFALLTGFMLGILLLSWSGGLLLVAILLIYMAIEYVMDHLRGRSTEHLCIIGVPMFLVAFIVVTPFFDFLVHGVWITIALLGGALAFLVLSGVSWFMNHRDLKRAYYPVAVIMLGGVATLLFWVIDPAMFNSIIGKFSIFNPRVTQLTIMEAQPVFSGFKIGLIFDEDPMNDPRMWRYFTYGLFVVPLAVFVMVYEAVKKKAGGNLLLITGGVLIALTALIYVFADMPDWFRFALYAVYGALLLIYAYFERSAGRVLLVLWTVILLVAMVGQTRFAYYFAVNAALLMAYFCWRMPGWISTTITWIWKAVMWFSSAGQDSPAEKRKKRKAEKRERAKKGIAEERKESAGVIADYRKVVRYASYALAVIAVFFLAFWPAIGQTKELAKAPWGPNKHWYNAMVWLRENTPEPFGDTDAYYQLYERPDAGEPYDYPDSAYGVMSWWDYGHWITRIGHRIPNANPFQHGIGGPRKKGFSYGASTFLTAQGEATGGEMLDVLGSKYVVIDIETATTKFYTPVTWSGQNAADYYTVYYASTAQGTQRLVFYGEEYYRSMCSRLYNFGAEAVEPNNSTWAIAYTESVDAGGNSYRLLTGIANEQRPFPTYEEAAAFVDANPEYIIVGIHPFISAVPLEELEHFEMVYDPEKTHIGWMDIKFPYVRIFEYTP
jgi:oligosaccharyl transferase (archaeosortase A-associated)